MIKVLKTGLGKNRKHSGYSVGLIGPHTRAMMILLTSARVYVRMCACVRLTVCSVWCSAKGVFCLLVDEGNEGWVSIGSGAFGEDHRRTLQSKHPFQLLQDAVLARKKKRCSFRYIISSGPHACLLGFRKSSHSSQVHICLVNLSQGPVMSRHFMLAELNIAGLDQSPVG